MTSACRELSINSSCWYCDRETKIERYYMKNISYFLEALNCKIQCNTSWDYEDFKPWGRYQYIRDLKTLVADGVRPTNDSSVLSFPREVRGEGGRIQGRLATSILDVLLRSFYRKIAFFNFFITMVYVILLNRCLCIFYFICYK